MVRTLLSIGLLCLACLPARGALAQAPRVYADGQLPDDSRLTEPKDLNGYFPFLVPDSRGEWEARAGRLRRQVRIATGIWPQPERTPLNAQIYGKSSRDGFTVEKVHFESVPGHYVTGLLFRPANGDGKHPGVLCPHGHGGRLQDYGEKAMAALLAAGAERFEKSGRFPKLARCANLARMGCVVFIFDMLGYADSVQITRDVAHGFAKQRPELENDQHWGLFSCQAEMRMQSIMGIQTWNSVRALDFLADLPDVDSKRLAVTGGSGGGTQTILLCAIDSRPIAGFPNGMVSTSMQGGCTCENCSLLRIETGNVELAALFAPKPQAMTAANDWTREMMTKGYPELKRLYGMLGVEDNVYCRPMIEFPHNYNYVSRTTMYEWFNRHLKLGQSTPIEEVDFEPLTPEEYTVWDAEHPAPKGGLEHELKLTAQLAEASDKQLRELAPTSPERLTKFREVIGGAFAGIVARETPAADDIQRTKIDKADDVGFLFFKDKLRLQPRGEEFPFISMFPKSTEWNGRVVVWVDGAGKQGLFNDNSSTPRSEVRRLIDAGYAVLAADLFQQGEFLAGGQTLQQQRVVKNPREFAGYTFAYNHTLLSHRVHDLMTLVSFIANDEHAPKRIYLVGVRGGGPVAALANVMLGDTVTGAAIDTEGFRFQSLKDYRDPRFLPGAVKYGDMPSLLALAAPRPLWIGGEAGKTPEPVRQAYQSAGQAEQVQSGDTQNTADAAVDWILK
ncbi:MAG: acetylxylan esterase [Planctomycetales bacterium]|nr:acetylxylan esterase [Planctomycetales bacterium]